MLLYKSEGDNVVIKFPKKTIQIPTKEFSSIVMDKIKDKDYYGGCRQLSSKGYKSKLKQDWCLFSHKVAEEMIFN